MNTKPAIRRTREAGWALLIVLSLAATGLLLVASIMAWANENAAVTARNTEYFATTYAAEAATEKALSAIVQDDQNYGEGLVLTKSASSAYSSLVPTAGDSSYWTNYQFSGGSTGGQVRVTCISTNTTNVLGPPYSGYVAVGSTYQIIANAQNLYSTFHITATVGQQVLLGQIPIFQFAIFYNDTLDIDPGAPMNVTGMVHGNTNIYIDPSALLTFYNDVSSTGNINLFEDPLDPSGRTSPTPTNIYIFDGAHLSDVIPLILPVGTNTQVNATNEGANVYAILQVPPPGESPTSSVGTNRLYNQVDMIITVSNGNVITVTSGVAVNNAATAISNNQWSSFISTNGSFYNMRDADNLVDPVDINVGALRQWSATNTVLRPVLQGLRGSGAADVQSVYVVDERFMSNTVVITNYSYTTNTAATNTTGYPVAGTYLPPVTTNTSQTTGSTYPGAGTFVPPILSTNTTLTTTSSHPGSGTYIGTITTNGSGGSRTYTYNKITGYIYNGVTGYTYAAITGIATNAYLTTNYVQYAEPGIVLTNGATLPPNGLSVVTPDPAYIAGNWNVSTDGVHFVTNSYNTVDTLPSAVYADAVTILSPAWSPRTNISQSGVNQTATADTVNAAILTGIVPSDGLYYSGGVENFPRFQENWSGVNFWYNGSMVEMFSSQVANYPWPGTGTVYNPPTRDWAFDTNFDNPSELPPLTPRVIYLNRARWASLPPGSTRF